MKWLHTIWFASIMILGLSNAAEVENHKLTASGNLSDRMFGESVVISGDYAIVGAPMDHENGAYSGAAYIYEYIGGVWTETAKLTASDGASYDQFGYAVSISGTSIILGSRRGDGNAYNSGAAYIYELIDGVWTEAAKLAASDGATDDYFGIHVAISGDYAIVGAYRDDDGATDSGSAYIYERSGGEWTEAAKLTTSPPTPAALFGGSVAISGNSAIVGSIQRNYACIYERTGGVWTETVKLTAGEEPSRFGCSVSISGDTALIGANFDVKKGTLRSGAAYVYEFIGGVWSQTAKLVASDGATNDHFGTAVSISGNHAIIGALEDDDNGPSSGSAYLYKRMSGVWSETAKLIASDGASDDLFGRAVSISDTSAIVGAPRRDIGGYIYAGSAYVFEFGQPPVADAGGPYVEGATGWEGASVTLDGLDSVDPKGGSLTYEWDLDLSSDSDSDGDPANDVDETLAMVSRNFAMGQTDIALVVRDEYGIPSSPDVTTVTVSFIDVTVDIKPGSYPNRINMGSKGVIPVAFLTDDTFDAATINPLTITLRGEDFLSGLVKLRGGKKGIPMATLKDVDGDCDLDLLVKLDAEALSRHEIDALCVLGALTYDGYVASGFDTIHIVPKKNHVSKKK